MASQVFLSFSLSLGPFTKEKLVAERLGENEDTPLPPISSLASGLVTIVIMMTVIITAKGVRTRSHYGIGLAF